jgi:hypothetical protein
MINKARMQELNINPTKVRGFIQEIEAQEINIEELRNYDRHVKPKRRG